MSRNKEMEEAQNKISVSLSAILSDLKKEPRYSSFALAIVDLLYCINTYMQQNRLKREDLEQFSFGIFRIVTDDYSFETSSVGKELLDLSYELRTLSRLV